MATSREEVVASLHLPQRNDSASHANLAETKANSLCVSDDLSKTLQNTYHDKCPSQEEQNGVCLFASFSSIRTPSSEWRHTTIGQ